MTKSDCPPCVAKRTYYAEAADFRLVPLADVERGLAKAPIESEPNFRLSKKSLSGLGETKFHLRTLLNARLKPTGDCKSTTTQILFTIGEGQIKYQTPSVTLFRQEHPNRCLCLGVR